MPELASGYLLSQLHVFELVHSYYKPQEVNESVISRGCHIGSFLGNRVRSLAADHVELSMITEQLLSHAKLVLQNCL